MGLNIQSKEVIDKISQDLKVQPALEIPRELMDKIQLVYNVNSERILQIVSANRATTGSLTPLTASTSKKTFVTGVLLSYMHNVVADSTAITTTLIGKGKGTSVLIQLPKLSLTADTKSQFVSLNPPIELEKGSDVIATHTFTVGAGSIASSVYFYEEDPQ